jgi:D-beta-D-heptose 7-phosphate kinase/D-beta-D-heptose 1-phosphate adenosyltransferase
MPSLLDRLAGWKPFNAVVVGDYMLDRLTYGNAERLSNDAPVPVLHVQREHAQPGGASNVCLDLAAMRGHVRCVGLVGADSAAHELKGLLKAAGVDTAGLVPDPTRPTTVKQSLIGLAQHRHPQKMFRLDYEAQHPVDAERESALLRAFESALTGGGGAGGGETGADVVCLEDYHKGVCTPSLCQGVIARARAAGVPVLVDPAPIADYSRYRGATAITPNRTEAQRASNVRPGDDAPPEAYGEAALRLLESLDLEASVITLDRHGAMLVERAGPARVIPTFARRVYDVSGAGDMVLAALAGARANGMDWPDSVKLANIAAGLEVEEFGVVPIPFERIHADALQRERATRGKLRTLDELLVEVAAHRTAKRRIVFTNGCFDVLHAGHVSLLRRAAALGDVLIVAVNDDASVRALKGPGRPVYPIQDRAQLLGELECVGAVVVFADATPEALIHAVRPDVLVKGAQYEADTIPGAAFVKSIGGRVELLGVVEGRSTTRTVEKIRGG